MREDHAGTAPSRRFCRSAGAKPAVHLREPGSTPLGEKDSRALAFRARLKSPRLRKRCSSPRRGARWARPDRRAGADARRRRGLRTLQLFDVRVSSRRRRDSTKPWCSTCCATGAARPPPDLTLILDLDARAALGRRKKTGDRIEDRGLDFQAAVARGYRRYVEFDPAGQARRRGRRGRNCATASPRPGRGLVRGGARPCLNSESPWPLKAHAGIVAGLWRAASAERLSHALLFPGSRRHRQVSARLARLPKGFSARTVRARADRAAVADRASVFPSPTATPICS